MSGMEPHKIAFSVGMATQNIHTFFDYVFNNKNFDIETGKKMSGWIHEIDGKIFGGYPATFESVKKEKVKLKLFVDALLVHQIHLDVHVKELLVAGVLRFYPRFIQSVRNEPTGKFIFRQQFDYDFCYLILMFLFLLFVCNLGKFIGDKVNSHRFVARIEHIKQILKIDDAMFKDWVKDINDGFEEKNYWALNTAMEANMNGANPRCVLSEMNNQSQLLRMSNRENVFLKEKVDVLNIEVEVMKRKITNLESGMSEILSHVRESKCITA